MEVRLLYENEIPEAARVVMGIYDYCVVPYAGTRLEIEQFREYVNADHFLEAFRKKELFFWGIFENGGLCAVSAIKNNGHITLLHVSPYCQRRGYATLLLNMMRMYAMNILHLNRITVNVAPVTATPFFLKRGFRQLNGMAGSMTFVPLECMIYGNNGGFSPAGVPVYGTDAGASVYMPNAGMNGYAQNAGAWQPDMQNTKKECGVVFRKRKVKGRTVAIIVSVVAVLLLFIAVTFTLCHIASSQVLTII